MTYPPMARRVATLLGAVALGALAPAALAQGTTQDLLANFEPITDEMLLNPDPADWLHLSRTYDQHHFSPLTQINKENVGSLTLAWSRGLPSGGSQQATPLVYNGIMYSWVPVTDGIIAVDATTGDLIWEYRGEYETSGRPKSIGLYQDMVYYPSADGFVRALNALTGEVVWETKMTGRTDSANASGGVLVADGKVLMNGSCAAFNPAQPDTSGRLGCYIVALDALTGEEVWKFYTAPADGEPGADTWPATVAEEARNASAWGVPGSYDPELGLTYWSTADPKPYTQLTRYQTAPGLHDGELRDAEAPADLYTNSTLALNIETGELAWYWQGLPADNWDADHNEERLLIDTVANFDPEHIKWINPNIELGVERKIVLYNAEGGGQFAVDRATGEFLWGRPFPYDIEGLNMNSIDPETGLTHINIDLVHTEHGDVTEGCFHNVRQWQVTAYSPQTNAQYMHFNDQCLHMEADTSLPTGWTNRYPIVRPGIDVDEFANLARIDMETGEMTVLYNTRVPMTSATLVTASGLVFVGDVLGRFRAFDEETGEILWETVLGGPVTASNISYEADGKQYVTVYTGDRGGAAAGVVAVADQLPTTPNFQFNAIYTFALPESVAAN